MEDFDAALAHDHPLLDAQLRLLRDRREDVADLLEMGGERELPESLVDAIANDLVGARLVLRAALAAPPPGGVSGARRQDLERSEREAGDLLRAALAAPRP